MRRMVLLLLVVLAVAPVASGAPDGFRESTRLTPIVSAVAGKTAPVYCPQYEDAWTTLIHSLGGDSSKVPGYVPPTDDMAYLNMATCRALEGWLRGKNMPTIEHLGWSVLTITHEAMHVRGLDAEGETDCAALAAMPRVLRVHFKVKNTATVRAAIAAAWRMHRLGGAAYAGPCG